MINKSNGERISKLKCNEQEKNSFLPYWFLK